MSNAILDPYEDQLIEDDSPMFLDTVELVIRLPYHMESTSYPFRSKKEWINKDDYGYTMYVFRKNNLYQIGGGEYIPSISYRIRRIPHSDIKLYELLVEFSVPKFILGNNFMDVPKSELSNLCLKLLDIITCTYHFEDVTLEMIKSATLKRMDCGSQVFFPDITAYNQALNRIRSSRLDARIDIDDTQYDVRSSQRATGLNISCGSWQFVFYNKTEELKRSAKKKKSKEAESFGDPPPKPRFLTQSKTKAKFETRNEAMVEDEPFFELITEEERVCVRFELRLNSKARINNALKWIGYYPMEELTLGKALYYDIPRKLTQYNWQQTLNHMPRYDLISANEEDVLAHIAKTSSTIDKMAKTLGYIEMERLPNQRQLRAIICNGKSRSAWTSYQKKLKDLPPLSNQPDPVRPVTDKIFGNGENCNVSTPSAEKPTASIKVQYTRAIHSVHLAISITIKYCTKNRHFFRLVGRLRQRANGRAPPSQLAARRDVGGALMERKH